MDVTEHSIRNYASRVLRIEPNQIGTGTKEFIREQIRKAVTDPELVYHGKKSECPIYIRNGVAVPAEKDDEGIWYVPTAYHHQTFRRKIDDVRTSGSREEAGEIAQ